MPPHVICVGGACIAHAQCSMARMTVAERYTLDGKECMKNVITECIASPTV